MFGRLFFIKSKNKNSNFAYDAISLLILVSVFYKISTFFFQNVLLEHMVSTVNIAVTHVSTSCVTERTDSVNMVVLKALMEIVVNFQVF
jgi:hypothetical protein